MARNTKIASVAFTGAAAAMTVGLTAVPGHAFTNWIVKNNGLHYSGSMKGLNPAGTTETLVDKATGVRLTCTTANFSGNIKSSTPNAPASPKIASIKTATYTQCTIGGTIPFTAKLNRTLSLHANAWNGMTQVPGGFLGTKNAPSAISETITGTGNNCRAIIIGSTIPWSFINGTSHTFVLNKARTVTLKVKTATSCGLVHTGDTAYASGKYLVSTPAALTIS